MRPQPRRFALRARDNRDRTATRSAGFKDNIAVLLPITLCDFQALTRRHCGAPQILQFLDTILPPDSNHLIGRLRVHWLFDLD